MDNGLAAASQFNLQPGIALTSAQVAALTSDIVWLVEKEVTLPNGSKQKALVPQVYVRLKDGDINGNGGLLSGGIIDAQARLDISAGRDLTVASTTTTSQNAQGELQGARLDLFLIAESDK